MSRVTGGNRKFTDAKLQDQHEPLLVHYVLKSVDKRWRVQSVEVQPFFGFSLASELIEIYHRYYFRAKEFRRTEEEKQASKRLYDELIASVVKHCK